MPIELADIILARIHRIATLEDNALARHAIPGFAGDLIQHLGRHSVRLRIDGMFYGPGAPDDLESLRAIYRQGDPVDFAADLVDQAYVGRVLVERLQTWQQAGEYNQISFSLVVGEYVEPPEPETVSIDDELADKADRFMALANLPLVRDPAPALRRALRDLESAVQALETALEPLRPIFGLVPPKSVAMEVVDQNGLPVSDLSFVFIAEDGSQHRAEVKKGKLEVDTLPPGKYLVLPEA